MKGYKKYFLKAIQDSYPELYPEMISQIESHYKQISQDTRFAITSKNPIDKRLDFCSYFLALIKTLDQQSEPLENIRKICLEIVTEYVRPKNQLQRFIKQLFPKMTNTWLAQTFLKIFHQRVSVNENADGFIANIITDKKETFGLGYGIDILECGICKLFNKHQYQKYTPILCEVDEITTGLAGLKLVRSGTIANGASRCDFRFIRKN